MGAAKVWAFLCAERSGHYGNTYSNPFPPDYRWHRAEMKTVYKPDDNGSHLTGWRYKEGWRSELLCWDPQGERWPLHCKLAGSHLIRSRIHGWSGCRCCSWVGSHYLQSPQEGSKSPADAVWSHSALSQFQLCCLEERGKEKFCNQPPKRNLQNSRFCWKSTWA